MMVMATYYWELVALAGPSRAAHAGQLPRPHRDHGLGALPVLENERHLFVRGTGEADPLEVLDASVKGDGRVLVVPGLPAHVDHRVRRGEHDDLFELFRLRQAHLGDLAVPKRHGDDGLAGLVEILHRVLGLHSRFSLRYW